MELYTNIYVSSEEYIHLLGVRIHTRIDTEIIHHHFTLVLLGKKTHIRCQDVTENIKARGPSRILIRDIHLEPCS